MINIAYETIVAHEVVRAAYKYGVSLLPIEHIQGLEQKNLDELSKMCDKVKGKNQSRKHNVSKSCLLRIPKH